jgi:hypothetical protein
MTVRSHGKSSIVHDVMVYRAFWNKRVDGERVYQSYLEPAGDPCGQDILATFNVTRM